MFVFGDFKKHVRLLPKKDCSTDNLIFRLHYRFTFLFLLVCTVLVSSRQFIKEHINCISDKVVSDVINTFCFFSATFTVSKLHNSSYVPGVHVVSPGVGSSHPDDERTYHAYYQWVPFVLFAQALMFYLPHYIWKNLEKGRVSAIVNHMRSSPLTSENDVTIKGQKIESDESKKKKEKFLKDMCLTFARFRVNRDWARNLVLCELLNVVNIIVQIYMVNAFLKGNFINLGLHWMESNEDILESVFPKVTKCIFHKFGSGGSIQVHDALCIMPLNIINEKVYAILWFWFVFLFFMTMLGLIWRLLTFVLHGRSGAFNRFVWREVSPGPALKPNEIEMIATKLSFADWLFLYYIGRNTDGRMFRRVIGELTQSLGKSLLTLRDSEKSNLNDESFC